ncbi:MAG: hypothetical protein KGQ51_05975 [Planctomycetes bacterium]|nr:hypothetical protein [Planctomycetota bacterium]
MSRNTTGFSFSLVATFALLAVMIFLSYGMILRRVETLPPDHIGSSEFAFEEKFRFESEVKRFDDQMDQMGKLTTTSEPSNDTIDEDAESSKRADTLKVADTEKTKKQPLSDSMRWLNQSIDSLSEKLNQISKKLENTQDQALVEAEIKRAFREAFVGELSSGDVAEVSEDSKSFDLPVLGEGIPEWIRQRVVEPDRLLIPIESSLHGTLEECRAELDSKLPQEVKKLIDEHVLRTVSADDIPGLTPEYIAETLIDPAARYDNYQERPSGNFHQMWVRLSIDKPKLEQIREWEREIITSVRVWLLGGLSLAFLGTFAGCSKVIQFLSTREHARRQLRQNV